MSGSCDSELVTTWCVLCVAFHQLIPIPKKGTRARPMAWSTEKDPVTLPWPMSWPKSDICCHASPTPAPHATAASVAAAPGARREAPARPIMAAAMSASGRYMGCRVRRRSYEKAPSASSSPRRRRNSRCAGDSASSGPASRRPTHMARRREPIARPWKASNWSLASRPARAVITRDPPGCCLAQAVTSSTAPRTTIQQSSARECARTSLIDTPRASGGASGAPSGKKAGAGSKAEALRTARTRSESCVSSSPA
mmetsp:Transcript_10719/g.36393  ORF Transcript_10719/g.36393 Transcript_10719/m.36393 type:complete len:254 (+) Transcript_10719:61-822(+)